MTNRKSARNRKKSVLYPVAKRHHLDRRADAIAAVDSDADDDELLTTREVAKWFGVSEEWVEIGRSKSYGPKFVRVGPHLIRYRRSECREYLKSRTYASTAEYEAA
jgi:predicted DNA-binding transcriptional regulator AlpA